jgi:hypothetical protein
MKTCTTFRLFAAVVLLLPCQASSAFGKKEGSTRALHETQLVTKAQVVAVANAKTVHKLQQVSNLQKPDSHEKLVSAFRLLEANATTKKELDLLKRNALGRFRKKQIHIVKAALDTRETRTSKPLTPNSELGKLKTDIASLKEKLLQARRNKALPRYNQPRCARPSSGNKNRPRVALCFYGLIRNLDLVLGSIERHIFGILDHAGVEYDVFVHSLFLTKLDNKRSGESNQRLNPYNFARLRPCVFEVEDQNQIRATLMQQYLKMHKNADLWNDNFASVGNLLCAMHSSSRVAALARGYSQSNGSNYSAVVALRADVAYLRDLNVTDLVKLKQNERRILTPDCSVIIHNGVRNGYNDRFAMGGADVMLDVFLKIRGASWMQQPSPGEQFLKFSFFPQNHLQHGDTNMRLIRVRNNGVVQELDLRDGPIYMNMPHKELFRCLEMKRKWPKAKTSDFLPAWRLNP